jgi:hypothetical protein
LIFWKLKNNVEERKHIGLIIYKPSGQAAITKLNRILWDRDVTPKTKTRINHAVVKSTITYAAETWRLKARKVAKLNSTEVDFGDARLKFPGRTKLGILLLNKK